MRNMAMRWCTRCHEYRPVGHEHPPSLFDADDQYELQANTRGKVRNDHPDTARKAAATVKTGTARYRVLVAIARTFADGMTDEELFDALAPTSPNTLRPRRVELVDAELVADSGLRRPSRSGHPAIVWTVTSRGTEQMFRADA